MCGSDYKPDGFAVTEGEAIALAVGERQVSCGRVETEPMDNETWAVHVDSEKPDGCEFSAEVDGETGKVGNRHRDCG